MKWIKVIMSAMVVLLLAACGTTKNGVYESQGGKEDVCYLFFQSQELYAEKVVDVTVDNKTFKAEVAKDKKQKGKYKGTTYAITPGVHHLKVIFEGKVLVDKKIILGSQETKTINL